VGASVLVSEAEVLVIYVLQPHVNNRGLMEEITLRRTVVYKRSKGISIKGGPRCYRHTSPVSALNLSAVPPVE